jgi:hypothetical protein
MNTQYGGTLLKMLPGYSTGRWGYTGVNAWESKADSDMKNLLHKVMCPIFTWRSSLTGCDGALNSHRTK